MRLAPVTLALLCAATVSRATTTFNYTPAEQTFIAPTTGDYQITVYGAAGGGNSGNSGGSGAEISATFYLIGGEQLDIYVGGVGGNPGDSFGGGVGGGSFVVVDSTGLPLIVAGGGGGAGVDNAGFTAQTGTDGGSSGTPGGTGGDGARPPGDARHAVEANGARMIADFMHLV